MTGWKGIYLMQGRSQLSSCYEAVTEFEHLHIQSIVFAGRTCSANQGMQAKHVSSFELHSVFDTMTFFQKNLCTRVLTLPQTGSTSDQGIVGMVWTVQMALRENDLLCQPTRWQHRHKLTSGALRICDWNCDMISS